MRRVLTSLVIVFTLLFATALSAGEIVSLVRINLETKQDFLTVASLHLDVTSRGKNYVDVVISPDKIGTLDQNDLTYSIRIPDMTSYYQSRFESSKAAPGSMGGYRTLSECELAMDSIATQYPLIVKPKWSIGQTLLNNDIWVMKVSDNPLVDEDEPEIFYFSAIHAREVITPEVLIYFLHYLTSNYGTDPQVTYLVDNREMFFTLNANPDGYLYNEITSPDGGGMWRKNRRNNGDGTYGVDLNRNYGYEWGYDNEGSSPYTSDETYRGPGPFSELESQAMRDFIISRDFVITVSYHSHGNLFIYPWGYDYLYTPDEALFAIMGDSATAFNGYDPGPSFTLYLTNGTTDDWGYGEQTLKDKNLAVTFEVGGDADGFWPSTSRITPLVQENLGPNLFFARVADNPQKMLPPEPPLVASIGDLESSSFELQWDQDDQYNPAISYDVWQYRGLTRVTDDYESGTDNWVLTGFSASSSRFHSNFFSLFSGSDDQLDSKATAVSSLSVGDGDSLEFWTWYETETDWDYGYVEASADGASWTSLAGNITTTTNPHGNNLGNGITGSSGGWVLAKFDLSAYQGQSVSLRFRYKTDAYVSEEGWYVDDVFPVESFSKITQLAAAYTDTSLLVTDLVEDEYYFQVFAYDSEGQKSGGSNLAYANVNFGPACEWLVGDPDGTDIINIADVVYLITYIFGQGDPPTPDAVGSGDADCNGVVSIADAVYIINYVFGGGPLPGGDCTCEDYL